jgi:hypothetical protein
LKPQLQPGTAQARARIARLVICEWLGARRRDHEIVAPGWELIEAAIRAMNGASRNDIYLMPREEEPDTYLCIGGGAGRYIATGSVRNEFYPTIVDGLRAAEPQEILTVGGQAGRYDANWIIDESTVIRVARAFYEAGDFAPELNWKRL